MPFAANPISVLLDAIFAMINIAMTIVFGYLGTVTTYAVVALVLLGATFAIIALLRGMLRR